MSSHGPPAAPRAPPPHEHADLFMHPQSCIIEELVQEQEEVQQQQQQQQKASTADSTSAAQAAGDDDAGAAAPTTAGAPDDADTGDAASSSPATEEQQEQQCLNLADPQQRQAALEACDGLKRQGNAAYARGDYDEALQLYWQVGCCGLCGVELRDCSAGQTARPAGPASSLLAASAADATWTHAPFGGVQQAIDTAPEDAQQRAVYYANAAACYLKQQQWQLAAEQCTAALKLDEGYIKVGVCLCERHWRAEASAAKAAKGNLPKFGPESRSAPCWLLLLSLYIPAPPRALLSWLPAPSARPLCADVLQALVRRSQALQEMDDLEHALADAQRVGEA
jgi:tetratricopeptide (TPR) repeat protein